MSIASAASQVKIQAIEGAPRPIPVDHEEVRWVEAARSGDEAAIRLLLARYRSRAVRVAAHVLRRDTADAEDMAQEAFVRAFGSLRSLRNSNEFWPWLSRIVVRLCLDRQRHAWWRRELPMEPRACSAQTRSETSSVDTRLLVELLLDQLSPPIRAALVLREIEGMDYSDVALALSIPVGTVRSRLNAARAQFRELWLAALREDDHG